MAVNLKWIQPADSFANAALIDEVGNTFATLSREDGFVQVMHHGKVYVLKQTGKLRTVIELALEGEPDLLGIYKAGFGQSGTLTIGKAKQGYKWKSVGRQKWAWFDNDITLMNFDIFFKKADEVGQITISTEAISDVKLPLLFAGWYLGILNTSFSDLPGSVAAAITGPQ